ncbi:hypothetical protein Tco_0042015, partial [Tanacetum coccineum]
VEGSSKRTGEELEQESSKNQKVDDEKETAELTNLMEVILDEEEVVLDAILDGSLQALLTGRFIKRGRKLLLDNQG